MRLAIDTNAYSAFARGESKAIEAIHQAREIAVPLPVLAELRSGFQAGTQTRQNEALLQRFLAVERVKILFPDEESTFHYARIYALLRKIGVPLPQNDMWIAALVIQHDCVLMTYDRHFDHLPQIPRW